MTPARPPGLYEELVTRRLEAALEEIRGAGWRDEIVSLVADGMTAQQIVVEYPDLEEEDVAQALKYAAWVTSATESR